MNFGISDTLKNQFPTVLPAIRPVVSFEGLADPNWLAGFVDGEGWFYVNTKKAKAYLTGFQVIMSFSITQHVRDELLLTPFFTGRPKKAHRIWSKCCMYKPKPQACLDWSSDLPRPQGRIRLSFRSIYSMLIWMSVIVEFYMYLVYGGAEAKRQPLAPNKRITNITRTLWPTNWPPETERASVTLTSQLII